MSFTIIRKDPEYCCTDELIKAQQYAKEVRQVRCDRCGVEWSLWGSCREWDMQSDRAALNRREELAR